MGLCCNNWVTENKVTDKTGDMQCKSLNQSLLAVTWRYNQMNS